MAPSRRSRRPEASRPADAVVGEEYGITGDSGRRWIIDPIDATVNFVRGVPVWATLIALEIDGEVAVGVVSAPALRSRWWADADSERGPMPGESRCRQPTGSKTPTSLDQLRRHP